jgi:integrase/recombinase XerD
MDFILPDQEFLSKIIGTPQMGWRLMLMRSSSRRSVMPLVRAEAMFKTASGGATLHQLRHSALTHDAEDGTATPMLMARSGHTSVRSLVRYARMSVEALQRHQAERDPARRR